MVEHQDRKSDATVWIVVLHWQGDDLTRACLESLRSLTYPDYKILLVDNGSPDRSGAALGKEFPEAELLETGSNLGYSGGCNAGINYCLTKGAAWIWLLNNDTKVNPDSLGLLMKLAAETPKAGALGAAVMTGEGNQFATSGAGEIDFIRAKTYLRKTPPAYLRCLECDWLSGSNLLLRAEALNQVGLFRDDYFLYFEDTELCWRLRAAGWKCLFVPGARVEHAGSASTRGERSYWRAYYYTRNRLLFFVKHARGIARVTSLISMGGHLVRHAIVLPLRGEHGRKQLKAEMLGLRDYVKKRFGKAACLDWCQGNELTDA